MNAKRLLIVSNNCLSRHNSNGRTLLNLLGEFSPEQLAVVFTSGEVPDPSFAACSLRLSNKDALLSYFGKRISPVANADAEAFTETATSGGAAHKNALTMLGRDLVFDHAFLLKRQVLAFAAAHKPDAVLLQLADNTLLITLGMMLAKKLNVPLVTYNTEDYYFKDYDYMQKSTGAGLMYRLFHRRFCKRFSAMMKMAPLTLYNCEGLAALYEGEFGAKGHVIYCATELTLPEATPHETPTSIVYAGNLGVGRHKLLIEVAKALHGIDERLTLDVYGKCTDEVAAELTATAGLCYHGFVDYEENCRAIQGATLLVHVESFDDYYRRDTRYAFSTKIADYCATGNPILVLAPAECEVAQYLVRGKAAFVVTDLEALPACLQVALTDTAARKAAVVNAKKLAEKNHQKKLNGERLVELLLG